MELDNTKLGDALYEQQKIHNEIHNEMEEERKAEFYPGEGVAHDEWHLPMINTIVAFYINVNGLTPAQAQETVEHYETKHEELAMRLDAQGSCLIFIPTTTGETRIETCHINM